jgi:hypothetical protein
MVGVASGLATDFSFIELFWCYFIGGSLGMVLYTFFGDKILAWWKARKSQSKENNIEPNNWKIRFWNQYGLIGVALITPPILSQPVGTAISLSFGTPAYKVIIVMCASMFIWSLIFAYAGHTIIQWL